MSQSRRRGRRSTLGCGTLGCLVLGFGLVMLMEMCSSPPPTPPPPSSTASESASPSPNAPDEGPIEIPLDSPDALEEASLTRNLYFILDGSGSMKRKTDDDCSGDQRFRTKIEGARWAVREFLAKVPDDIAIALYVFDKNGREERVPLGLDNRDDFLSALEEVRVGGGTPLAEGIQFGTEQLVEQYKRQLGYGEFRLVVVTDGQADHIPAAATLAGRYGIPIYAIGLCIGEDHPLRTFALSYRAADNFADLARGLEETLAELPSFDVTEFDATEFSE